MCDIVRNTQEIDGNHKKNENHATPDNDIDNIILKSRQECGNPIRQKSNQIQKDMMIGERLEPELAVKEKKFDEIEQELGNERGDGSTYNAINRDQQKVCNY